MVKTLQYDKWKRTGFSLLWDTATLKEMASPSETVDLRGFVGLAGSWPDLLPSCNGDAVIVTGMEGVLDSLDADDLADWLENDLRPLASDFEAHYQCQAALIMWLPSGRKRIEMSGATEQYYWKVGHGRAPIALGQLLWGGSEEDVERILVSDDPKPDPDGSAWCGLHHPRIHS